MSAGTTLGRPVRAAREHQEPTPARNALRGGGLLVLGALPAVPRRAEHLDRRQGHLARPGVVGHLERRRSCTTVVVYVLGASGRAGPTPVRLALAGAAVSASLSGVIAGLTVFGSATYDYLRFCMVGSLAGREPELVVQLLFTALVWADERIGWIQVVEESQRNNLLPVGVTTAVLGGVYLAWVPFKRRGTGTA
ncbi:iron chelate uptake ABC transporter family permease subunit [Streptomyces cyaneofuscatus]|uniref:iron chelate uptake ABC transporter family permease subunit n=1 Tax=Streptomyces cyaneofuscatus TaxID=66883 RepID=UPI0037A61D4D